MSDEAKILVAALCWKAFNFSLATLQLGVENDSSSRIYLGLSRGESSCLLDRFLLSQLRWDAVQMAAVSEGGYLYESQHAFFPVYPLLCRAVSRALISLFCPDCCVFARRKILLSAGLAISNVSFLIAAVLLLRLSKTFFRRSRIPFLSALLFVVQPGTVFVSSMYSESLFAMLCFLGMFFYQKRKFFLASVVWGLSSATRSNGIAMAGFFLYSVLLERTAGAALRSFLYSAVSVSGFFLVDGYAKLSKGGGLGLLATFKETLTHNSYVYVQRKYWDVGLFRFWALKQVPGFLYALPMILFSVAGLVSYFGGLVARSRKEFFTPAVFPYFVLWMFMTLQVTTAAHVNIIYRLFSSLPPVYWYGAYLAETKDSLLLLWISLSVSVSTGVLFSLFYPPT
ncbi:MAG: GPI mannosyltransferase 2 [Amphiamblys sp. WSBS2006]|nr:MAG: GPI mannosyltransferase 2 [Amphiamblys sp. WSBS2006]